jgi:hypothetical protein
MKIKVDVDCTPDEARAFLGLPDVKPLQETMMKELQSRMTANMGAMDPETLFKTWMPVGLQGMEQLQKMFWSQMAQAGKPQAGKSAGKPDPDTAD